MLTSNPLKEPANHRELLVSPPPPTQTIGAHTVNFEATVALHPLLRGIQTQAQLDEIVADLNELQYV